MDDLAAHLARLSAAEMVAALGWTGAPWWTRRAGEAAFTLASRPLGAVLARFDRAIAEDGLPRAAASALARLGARVTIAGSAPREGALLVLSNHPGAYDALALMAGAGRRDLAILAADRPFLRALPSLSRHLVPVPDEGNAGRARALRFALRHLRAGGALLHFGAGRIEPDPAFALPHEEVLAAWGAGTGALIRAAARADGQVLAAMVSGVHSARAKRFFLSRMAERRGITTLAPLLQVALPGFREVDLRVAFGAASRARGWLESAPLGGTPLDTALAARARQESRALRPALQKA